MDRRLEPAPVSARLVGLNGALEGQHFELRMDQYIGLRHCSDSEIAFPSTALRVSRRHARISFEDGGFVVRDCSSMAGSYCNGVPIGSQPHPLTDGDVLRAGDAEFRFERIDP